MANGNKLYSAYRGAGKAAASYKSSLYDIENLGIEREGSQSMYQFREQQRDKNLALIQQGISLASDVYGGYKAKKEAAASRTSLQEGMAKKAYGESEAEKLKKDKTYKSVDWDKLEDKSSYMSKFSPKEVERSFLGKVFGEEKKYTFGEGKDEFTSAQITAASSLHGENKLADLLDIGSKSKLEKAQESLKESVSEKESEEKKNLIGSGAPKLNINFTGNLDVPYSAENQPEDKKSSYREMINRVVSPKRDEETGLPSYMLKSGAKGLDYTTDGPEMILVGDNPGGKEKVKVSPIKSKSKGKEKLADNIGVSLKDLVSKKGSKPGSKKWMNEYISSQKINNESLRPLQGELSKHNKKLFSMAEEAGYFGEFFRGGWE